MLKGKKGMLIRGRGFQAVLLTAIALVMAACGSSDDTGLVQDAISVESQIVTPVLTKIQEEIQEEEARIVEEARPAEEPWLAKEVEPVVRAVKEGAVRGDFGPYTWRVLAIEGDMALLITQDVVEQKAYHEINEAVTWENATLRQYLNDTFYDQFSDMEKSVILRTEVVSKDNTGQNNWYSWSVAGGNEVGDYIFLLSLEEVEQYFEDHDDRMAKYIEDGTWWWLRSPGHYDGYAAYVLGGGWVSDRIFSVDTPGGVRPALYLNLNP